MNEYDANWFSGVITETQMYNTTSGHWRRFQLHCGEKVLHLPSGVPSTFCNSNIPK